MSITFSQSELDILQKNEPELLKNLRNMLEKNSGSYSFRVSDECIGPLSKYVPYNYISKGTYGVVFQVCDNTEGNCKDRDINTICNQNTDLCKYVIKVLHPIFSQKEQNIENEIAIAQELGSYDKKNELPPVGPEVIYSFKCGGWVNYGDGTWNETQLYFIVMRKMDLTLKMYKDMHKENGSTEYIKNLKEIENKVSELSKNMNSRGYSHVDLHDGNIMINVKDDKIIDVKIIDFGSTKGDTSSLSFPTSRQKRYEGKPRPLNVLVREVHRIVTILGTLPDQDTKKVPEIVKGPSGRVFEVTDDDEDD